MRWLSVVMPVRNEAKGITQVLGPLQNLRDHIEIIVVDGGSTDATAALAAPLADQVFASPPGRARQMNTGAAVATGEVLLFLHADTELPEGFVGMIRAVMFEGANVIPAQAGIHSDLDRQHHWGRFDVRLAPSSPTLRLVAWMMNRRSRLTGICTGDQAIFVRRDLFNQLSGYADIPLMEDIELSKRLKRISPPACIRQPLTTSSRRWQTRGVLRTIVLMWWLRLQYWAGVSPARLAKKYYPGRQSNQ